MEPRLNGSGLGPAVAERRIRTACCHYHNREPVDLIVGNLNENEMH